MEGSRQELKKSPDSILSIFHYTRCSQQRLMSVHDQALLHPGRKENYSVITLRNESNLRSGHHSSALIKPSSKLCSVKEGKKKEVVGNKTSKVWVHDHQNQTITRNHTGKNILQIFLQFPTVSFTSLWQCFCAQGWCSNAIKIPHLETGAWSTDALSTPRSACPHSIHIRVWQCSATARLPSGA